MTPPGWGWFGHVWLLGWAAVFAAFSSWAAMYAGVTSLASEALIGLPIVLGLGLTSALLWGAAVQGLHATPRGSLAQELARAASLTSLPAVALAALVGTLSLRGYQPPALPSLTPWELAVGGACVLAVYLRLLIARLRRSPARPGH